MRLQHIEIHNFRCFSRFELAIDGDSLTFVAPNAGGKSTLLTGIAWALGGARGVTRSDLADPDEQLLIIATVGDMRQEEHGIFVEGALRFAGPPTVRIGVRATWDDDAEQLDVDWASRTRAGAAPAATCAVRCRCWCSRPIANQDASSSSQGAAAS